ncbi:MAG: DNA repair protein RecN [Bacillota bacterium]
MIRNKMLHTLTIKNIALIEDLTIEFTRGLNVITGETGAGKSVILEALELVLGKRANSDYIRTGASQASIEAVFMIDRFPDCLIPLGIEQEEGCLVFRRELYRQGKSLSRINGQAVPLALCREAAGELIDFLIQHEQQEIYLPLKQENLLDTFSGLVPLGQELAQVYRLWREVKENAEAEFIAGRERLRRADNLRYQVEEIAKAGLRIGESEELLEEREWLSNAARLKELAFRGQMLLSGDDRSAVETVGEAAAITAEIAVYRRQLATYASSLKETTHLLVEAARELEHLVDQAEYDPHRIDAVESRLDLIDRLRRKYGDNVAEVLSYREKASQELEDLERKSEEASNLQSESERLEQEWTNTALRLQTLRDESARRLENEMILELGKLAMGETLFKVVFSPAAQTPNPRGLQEVEIHISPNPGEPLKPLARIASGGEAARVIFALKVLTAANEQVGTLFLDEVDTGVSGQALEAVAARLDYLSGHRQVLCITHQALVAAKGSAHHLIQKQVINNRANIRVIPLKGEERIKELARLVGGAPETAREHAVMLLDKRVGWNVTI